MHHDQPTLNSGADRSAAAVTTGAFADPVEQPLDTRDATASHQTASKRPTLNSDKMEERGMRRFLVTTAALNSGTIGRDVRNDELFSPKRNRGWLLATAAVLVVLIGTACGDTAETTTTTSPPDIQTTTTTEAPPPTEGPTTTTTAAPTTTTTEAPVTTVPATTAPATTVPPPQTYDATLTWDGETCTFEGPGTARVRDTLSLAFVNDSSQWAFFLALYMTSSTTLEDASEYFDGELGNVLNVSTPDWSFPGQGRPSTTPPPFFLLVDETGAMASGGTQVLEITLRQAREHIFTCSGSDMNNNEAERSIDNAPQSILVTE